MNWRKGWLETLYGRVVLLPDRQLRTLHRLQECVSRAIRFPFDTPANCPAAFVVSSGAPK
jgi:hypothetical protein